MFTKIKLFLIALFAGVGGVLVLILKSRLKKGDKAIKQNKILKTQKKKTHQLNEEKKDVDIQTEGITDKLDTADPGKLADSYNDKLQDKPKRKRSRDK